MPNKLVQMNDRTESGGGSKGSKIIQCYNGQEFVSPDRPRPEETQDIKRIKLELL